MNSLPPGWTEVALGDVALVQRQGVAPTEIQSGTTYVGLEHISPDGSFLSPPIVAAGELASQKFRFGSEHVLFGKLRPYLSKIASPSFDGVCSTDILPLCPGSRLDKRFLFRWLRRPEVVNEATRLSSGANLPRISPGALIEMKMPLPPIEEQWRIAAVLDQADELRAKRRAALALLDTLTESIFLDMFGDPGRNPRDLPVHELRDVVAGFEAGKSVDTSEGDNETATLRVIKVSAVTSGRFKPGESKPIPAGYEAPPAHRVRRGDLLFSRANTVDLVGASALVAEEPDGLLLSDKIWRFVWRDEGAIRPEYVWQMLQFRSMRARVGSAATGSSGSMKNISQQKVLGLFFPVAGTQAQDAFARAFHEARSAADSLRGGVVQSDELFASLQQRAFRGEL